MAIAVNGLQSPRRVGLRRQFLDFRCLRIDACRLLRNLLEHVLAFRARQFGQIAARIIDDFCDATELGDALRSNVTIFVKAGPQRIHQLGALMNKTFPAAK